MHLLIVCLFSACRLLVLRGIWLCFFTKKVKGGSFANIVYQGWFHYKRFLLPENAPLQTFLFPEDGSIAILFFFQKVLPLQSYSSSRRWFHCQLFLLLLLLLFRPLFPLQFYSFSRRWFCCTVYVLEVCSIEFLMCRRWFQCNFVMQKEVSFNYSIGGDPTPLVPASYFTVLIY